MIEGGSMYFGEDAGKHCVAMSLSALMYNVWFPKIPIPSPRRVFSQFDPPLRRIFVPGGLHGIPLPPGICIIFPLAPPPPYRWEILYPQKTRLDPCILIS